MIDNLNVTLFYPISDELDYRSICSFDYYVLTRIQELLDPKIRYR